MPDYKTILERADAFFAGVVSDQPDALACRLGCSICCHGLFEISGADLSVLADGLDRLDEATRAAIVERSRRIVEETRHPALRDCSPEEKETFFARAADVPCPALGEGGRCLVYASRPLVCRTFGLPLRDGNSFLGEECELNFIRATREDKERAAWDLQWEDVLGPEDEMTIPEAVLMIERVRKRSSVAGANRHK